MSELSPDIHRKFAVDCFNGTWELLDKTDRTPDEEIKMIHMAHASRYHWGEIGTPLEFARGEWQISRVYSVLGLGESAKKYGKISLNICLENQIGDFDLAFAYESLTRAAAVLGNWERVKHFKELAEAAGYEIEDKGNQDYFFSELETI